VRLFTRSAGVIAWVDSRLARRDADERKGRGKSVERPWTLYRSFPASELSVSPASRLAASHLERSTNGRDAFAFSGRAVSFRLATFIDRRSLHRKFAPTAYRRSISLLALPLPPPSSHHPSRMRLSFGRRVYDGCTIAVAFPRIDRILWLSISISKTGFISVMSQVYRIANSTQTFPDSFRLCTERTSLWRIASFGGR